MRLCDLSSLQGHHTSRAVEATECQKYLPLWRSSPTMIASLFCFLSDVIRKQVDSVCSGRLETWQTAWSTSHSMIDNVSRSHNHITLLIPSHIDVWRNEKATKSYVLRIDYPMTPRQLFIVLWKDVQKDKPWVEGGPGRGSEWLL